LRHGICLFEFTLSSVLLTFRSVLGPIEKARSDRLKSVAVWFSKNLGRSCLREIYPVVMREVVAIVVVLLGVLLTTLLLVLSTVLITSFIWY